MSICGGVAGARGKNPVGIFIHNDAGGSACTMAHYRSWLPGHNKSDGFAHYYVCSDGTLQAEDDGNRAWHCGQTDGNNNYLSIEVCQSMGDLNTFKANEEKALQLAAQKCKQYGITPNNNTIKLHKEVYATACPHRSVEIHGGDAATKAYFIQRIKDLMAGKTGATVVVNTGTATSAGASKKGTAPDIYYAVWTKNHGKLPEVKNRTDFAGIANDAIVGVKMRVSSGSIQYRVHVVGKGWYGKVTGCDWNDYNNGYAGDGKNSIDAIQIYYTTDTSKTGGKYYEAVYQVKPHNKNSYYPNIHDTNWESGDGNKTAGAFGVPFTQLLCSLQ